LDEAKVSGGKISELLFVSSLMSLHFLVFEVIPIEFIRIEIGAVWRQVKDIEAFLAGNELTRNFGDVRRR